MNGWSLSVYRRTKKGDLLFLHQAEVEVKEGVTEEQARKQYEDNLNEMSPRFRHVVQSLGETEMIDFSKL